MHIQRNRATMVSMGGALMKRSSELKAYLTHGDPVVRRTVLRYFAGSVSDDPDLMVRVLDLLPTVDVREQRSVLVQSRRFMQTPASIERLGEILISQPQLRDLAESLFLLSAPILLSSYSELFSALSHKGGQVARKRLELLQKDSQELLARLEGYADQGNQSWNETGHQDAMYLIRELAGREDAPWGILASWAFDRGHDEVSYREILGVTAVGCGPFEKMAERLLDNFAAENDLLNEETEQTLTVLATPELVQTIV